MLLAGAAQAEPLELKRGVHIGLWLDWRSIDELMSNPAYVDERSDTTPEQYRGLVDQGFDFVRAAVDPGPLLAFGPGEVQDKRLALLRSDIQVAVDAGLKVVVDLHPQPRGTDPGGIESILGPAWPDYVALTRRIAATLADLPADRVALEPLNEPTIDCDAVYAGAPARWPAMQAEAHAAVRSVAPDMTVILTGACWSQANALASLDPGLIPDDNVLWTFHSYEPYLFTHQGAGWAGPPQTHFWNLPYPPSAVSDQIAEQVLSDAIAHMTAETGTADVALLTQALQDYRAQPDEIVSLEITRAADWADSHGIPRAHLFLGEFGALHTVGDRSLPREWFHAFLSDKRRAAEEAGMSWAVLTWVGGMGIAPEDDPQRRLAPETCAALGLPCAK